MKNEEVMAESKIGSTVSTDAESTATTKHFFKREDWVAALVTFFISAWVFFRHMAPEVTLQDSGELVTGAFTFGVPHPPGYPVWAFLGYIWSHFIVPFGNPAWRIGTMSAFTGALTVGIMTLMMTRSTRVLLHALPWAKALDGRLLHWIALGVGMSSSLLFGFNRGVWLWASVSEMRVLNAFSFVLIACFFFAWMTQPQRKGFLYAALLTFGLSMTNHQTVAVMAVALVAGTLALGVDEFLQRREEVPAGRGRPGAFGTLMSSLSTFWDLFVAVLFSLAVVFALFAWLKTTPSQPQEGQPMLIRAAVMLLGGMLLLAVGLVNRWIRPRMAFLYMALFLSGCAFYLYMPIAASTNPPMNWGYASTKEGFLHAITRGQYEKLSSADPCAALFGTQLKIFVLGLCRQYSPLLCVFGLVSLLLSTGWLFTRLKESARQYRWLLYVWLVSVPVAIVGVVAFRHLFLDEGRLAGGVHYIWGVVPTPLLWGLALPTLLCALLGLWLYLHRLGRAWMFFVWTAFLVTSLGLIIIINPKVDAQEQEITIKFFAPAHGFFAMLIGYGIALAFAGVMYVWRGIPPVLVKVCCVALLALPIVPYNVNWNLCALGTHDFGYQFGYRMFCPGGGYPDMTKDAVLFGGTDPGRFVPTYMIFCESAVKPKDRYQSPWMKAANPAYDGSTFDRSDVYIITQNALADGTYMSYIRDHYDHSRPTMDNYPDTVTNKFNAWQSQVFKAGWTLLDRKSAYPEKPIRIPGPEDSQAAFQQLVKDWEAGKAPPGADLKIVNGRVQVSGALGVMAINGILARWIFDWNKDEHDFYVEESYVIQWMYPYLRPAGVIMKIEKEPLPSPQQNRELWNEIVAKDKAYWNQLTEEFVAREEFIRSRDARKSFSKMRSAIAGLYLNRGLIQEAEYAFAQAVRLCPESPEGCFRLAELYMGQRRFDDARKLIADYLTFDEYNASAKNFLAQLEDFSKNEARRITLQQKIKGDGGADLNDAMELLMIYARMNMNNDLLTLGRSLLDNTNAPPELTLELGVVLSNVKQVALAQEALTRYTSKVPRDPRGWIELGWIHISQNKANEAYAAWSQAVKAGGDAARVALRDDPRFQPIWQEPNLPKPFLDLLPPPSGRGGIPKFGLK